MDKIDVFDGQYRFLSNFYPATVVYEGIKYASSECAFQAAKCKDIGEREQFASLNPSAAKRLGRHIELRPDWESVKDFVMEEIVRDKFFRHKDLAEKLLETGDAELVEGNTWKDIYWGVDLNSNYGQNKLGKILMKIRSELQGEKDYDEA